MPFITFPKVTELTVSQDRKEDDSKKKKDEKKEDVWEEWRGRENKVFTGKNEFNERWMKAGEIVKM